MTDCSKLTRSAKVTFEILEGADILAQGQTVAQRLWNHTCWCLFGHNEQLRRIRGDSWERFKRNSPQTRGEKYPGNFGMQKELKDYWAAVALSDRCFSYTIKDLDIAMRSWFSNLKSNPKARPPRYAREPRQLTFEVGRNAKQLESWIYRLTVLGGKGNGRHALIRVMIQPGIKMRDIKLIRVQPDMTGTVVYYKEQRPPTGQGVAGVDLGIINLAAVAFQNGDSILYSGKGLLSIDRLNQKRAGRCKPKDWRKGQARSFQSERTKSYRRKSGDIRILAIHNITTDIIRECVIRGIGLVVLGDLIGIREDKDFGKAGNQKFHAWAFSEIRRQLVYKAEEYGIEVTAVSERYTSQTCHMCGIIRKANRQKRGNYVCRDCGIEINADINGAFNILNKVSPAPAYAGVGVGGDLPAAPSLVVAAPGTGKAQSKFSQISPTFVARFDLRNFSIVQTSCNRRSQGAVATRNC